MVTYSVMNKMSGEQYASLTTRPLLKQQNAIIRKI